MSADRRNAAVVVALVVAMTVGAAVLLCFESLLYPRLPRWQDNVALTARAALAVDEVQVSYAASADELDAGALDPEDSLVIIYGDGRTRWEPRGPRVRLIVVGGAEGALGTEQKKRLLAALGSLSQASGRGWKAVPVRLAGRTNTRGDPDDLPQAARELYTFLIRKGFVLAEQ